MAFRHIFNLINSVVPLNKKPKIDKAPLGEAFPYSVIDLSQNVEPIVLGYLGGDIGDAKSTPEKHPQFTLFYRNLQTLRVPYQAALAAEKMIWCDADGVEELVKKNPSILEYRIPQVKDPCGRILEDITLLRLAGAMGDFNPREMKPGEKPYGMVERLACYLSPNKVAKELSEQFPLGWEAETNERMQEYYAALTTFTEDLIHIPAVPPGSTLEAECKSIIETYRDSLNSAANKKVGGGLIYSPQIFVMAIEYYIQKKDRLDGWYSAKSDLFFKIGYGELQQRASGDAPTIKHGIYNVVGREQIPSRSLKFAGGGSYYPRPEKTAGAGSWAFFIDAFGERVSCVRAARAWVDGVMLREDGRGCCTETTVLENLCRAKTSALQNLCSRRTIHRKAIR